MKTLLSIALIISLVFNYLYKTDNDSLRLAINDYLNTIHSYTAILDINDAEYLQRQEISKVIMYRNRHVPAVISEQWAKAIQETSQIHKIPVSILLNLYQIESSMIHYNSSGFITISNKGAGGLGQIMPFWYKKCPYSNRPSDLNNGYINIMCSGFILRTYLNENNNNMFMALTAYNGGPRGVRLMKKGIDITKKYAIRVFWNQKNPINNKLWDV